MYLPSNLQVDEVYNIADQEQNELALRLYKLAYKEGYEVCEEQYADELPENTDFPTPSDNEIFDNINFFYNLKPSDWNKKADGHYVVRYFDGDTNLYKHHIEIIKKHGTTYNVNIACSAYGEELREVKGIDGLKNAKNKAVELAVKLSIEKKLNC